MLINRFVCPICGNNDIHSIGYLNGKPYCRKCISFRGQEAVGAYIQNDNADYELHYDLSEEQIKLSENLLENFKQGIDTLVHAVCGSGKTEIVLQVIAYAIKNHMKVGFAIPRRDVVRELFLRFKSIFKNNNVRAIYGGHSEILEGDLICLTTHQLFRYENYFDLLIIDEIDAFPFDGNEVLEAFFKRSIRGHTILLSATPSKQRIEEFSKEGKMILRLDKRFHGHPLPVPQLSIHRGIMKYYHLIQELRTFYIQNKPVFIFVPTIEQCEQVYEVLKLFFKEINFVHSKCDDRSERIDDFRKGRYRFLVTTAVLERGVTIKNLQVIVFNSDHPLYTASALIQISGRVGRKKDAPTGEVIFIAKRKTDDMVTAINEIKRANQSL